jgi:hypothetical protein
MKATQRDELLRRYEAETDRVGERMDQVLVEMEAIDPAARNGEKWTALTNQYLELQRQHRELAARARPSNDALDSSSDKQRH